MASKKKEQTTCPKCGKKYSPEEKECPHCASDGLASENAAAEELFPFDQSIEKKAGEDMDDLAKWLMGDDSWISSGIAETAGAHPGTKASVQVAPVSVEKDENFIQDWLQGKVDDITGWFSGESEARAKAMEKALDEVEERATYTAAAEEELQQIMTDLKEGKRDISEVSDKMLSLLSEMHALRKMNEELNDELESVRKGSTALAKYFKSYQGKDEFEVKRITDELAKEMATREDLEIRNLEMRAKIDILEEQLETGIQGMPFDEQDMKRLQIEIAEKDRILKEREDFLRDREKELSEQEATNRQVMKERFTAELQERIRDFEKNEVALKRNIEKQMVKNRELEIDLKHKMEEISLLYEGTEGGEFIEGLKEKLSDIQRIERELALRDHELQSVKNKLQIKEDEMKAIKEPIRYKEDEILTREEDLMHREKLLEEEMNRLEQTKAELASQDEIELKRRLEQLQDDITMKEEDIINREKYLSAKEDELRIREQSVISDEIDKREEERALEFKIEKVKIGIRRLDDLLIGGLPFGTNVLLYGPAFTGKEVIVNEFIAEGLKKGIPVIWVTTEKTPEELREEMRYIVSGFEEYEKLDLVRFVDSYSRSMGDESTDPNVFYVDSPTDFQALQTGIEKAAGELLKNHKYYRFVFRSISTMIAYLDPATAFKFLNPIIGRRKRDKSVGMYIIEKGMHGEQEIQMVGSLMDGMIELKIENLNTFMAVKGIGEVQSRAWIRYTATKSAVNIGSFALDHIR